MKYAYLASLSFFGVLVLFASSAMASELDGLSVRGTMKQIIGTFDSYGIPQIGDNFELNLTNLPQGKISFTRLHDPQNTFLAYVPFGGSLAVQKVEIVAKSGSIGWSKGCAIIHLTTDMTIGEKFMIEIWVGELKKGSLARIYIYKASRGYIGSMAEAEGVLK
jgi:hypothetical protein